jgi:type II restriction/modification system DNA methylase subunit YeeA
MNVQQFQATWRDNTLTERAASQSHFNDLCRLVGVPTPTEADPSGDFFTFERGATTTTGGKGWADVWYRHHFAWEYKGHHANLDAAYQQLLKYREDLENPPLLVVCDLDHFEIHTNFTDTVKQVHRFSIEDLDQPETFRLLRALFTDPQSFRPGRTVQAVTEEAAARFGALATRLHARDIDPHRAAHFLVQILFCLFAEDVGLLPKGLFGRLLRYAATSPEDFSAQMEALLTAMRDGGTVAFERIDRFNGGLFAEIDVVALTADELAELASAAELDWSSIEPAIIGTLFERSLDPASRAQLGAHYTGRADILRVVEPVLMAPLRRRWAEVRAEAETLKAAWDDAKTLQTRRNRQDAFARKLFAFQEELAAVRVLDPACGSGNFLYVALAALKDLEKEIVTYATSNGLPAFLPRVAPGQLLGLEVSGYARELAQVVVWIGYLQWMRDNGFQVRRDPVLEPLETIRLQDALLDRTDPDQPKEAAWPEADVIIGNPPFLGGKRLRAELRDDYVDDLFAVYDDRVAREADLVCYFFEKARAEIAAGRVTRAGLLATNSIRGGANRRVLERIKQTGDIFAAWDDEPWILNGAAVRIAIVGFDDGSETARYLDAVPVQTINADLTGAVDVTAAKRLQDNVGIGFQAGIKVGAFDIPSGVARRFLAQPLNPNGRPNTDVIKPFVNGLDITRRSRDVWIIDFGVRTALEDAAMYESPFEYVRQHVYPVRATNRDKRFRDFWWLHGRPRVDMREAIDGLARYIATPTVAKHRLFVWLEQGVYPDHQLIVFARDDDYFFGVLHSRAHEVWSLRMGTWLGVGNDPRYTPTTCFETFPLPWPPGQEPAGDPRVAAIATAAKRLDDLRRAWLNPEGADPAELKKRTLTNLYNARPTWLANAHTALDRAVWSSYGWPAEEDPATVAEDTILSRLLALNLERAGGDVGKSLATPALP